MRATVGADNRRPDIQGLRAVAVLVVVAFHAGLPLPGGFVGVDVFFVISGFVITSMLQREWASTGRIAFARFYVRRFKRLTPALALVVSVTAVAAALILSPLGPQQTATKTGLGAMLLSANFVIAATTGGYFDAPAATNPLLNTWSLSVEEQFYLAFPALLALGWLIGRRLGLRFAPIVLTALAGTASFAVALAGAASTAAGRSEALLGFYSPFTRAWEFAVGALLALGLSRLTPRSGRWALALGLTGGALLVASVGLIDESTVFPGLWTLVPVAGTALLLLAGSGPRTAVGALLATRPMVTIGDWSYSIYLWHWPCIAFAVVLWPDAPYVAAGGALGSFLPAVASYVLVEQPIRRISGLARPRMALLVALTLLPPLLLSGGGLAAAQRSGDVAPPDLAQGTHSEGTQGTPPQQALYQAATPFHIGNRTGCHTAQPISERSARDCTWNATAPGSPVYLVGDSNADHFGEAVIGAAQRLGRPAIIATIDTCPFFDVYLESVGAPDPFFAPCRDYYQATLTWLADQAPGLVVISNSDLLFRDPAVRLGLTPGSMSSDPEAKAQARAAGLAETAWFLQDAGHTVLLVQTVPHFVGPYAYQPDACSAPSINAGTCARTMPREAAEQTQGPPRRALANAAEQTGATVLDLWDVLCPAGTCATRNERLVLYRDAYHISVPASQALIPHFEQAIAGVGVGGGVGAGETP